MIDAKITTVDGIRRQTVEAVLAEFEKMIRNKVNELDARIRSEKHTAPESYINDLKGFSRGISITGEMALKFFREKLLNKEQR
jgi:hypothetical protein